MTLSKSAFPALLLIDTLALPLLIIVGQFSLIAAIVGALLVMLIHPLLLWRLQ